VAAAGGLRRGRPARRRLEEEFGERTGRPASAKQAFWWLVAVITLIAFLWLSLRGW